MNLNNQFEDHDSFVSKLIREKANQLVRHPGFSKSDREDIEQELRMELIVKSVNFDPKRAHEVTFIARVIERKAASLIRARQAEKRHFRHSGNSLNEIIPDGDGESAELGQMVDTANAKRHTGQAPHSDEELTCLKLDFDNVLNSLPEDLRKLAEMLTEITRYGASRQLGVSRRQVANKVALLRERFENSDLRDYF
ncbi:MAG: hypothetical protein JXM70_03985 [Pirellulales bacterium]|nr:hypothetical protein [Pirellulales bacterium]